MVMIGLAADKKRGRILVVARKLLYRGGMIAGKGKRAN